MTIDRFPWNRKHCQNKHNVEWWIGSITYWCPLIFTLFGFAIQLLMLQVFPVWLGKGSTQKGHPRRPLMICNVNVIAIKTSPWQYSAYMPAICHMKTSPLSRRSYQSAQNLSMPTTHLISCLQVFKASRISLEIRWHKLTFSFASYTWRSKKGSEKKNIVTLNSRVDWIKV